MSPSPRSTRTASDVPIPLPIEDATVKEKRGEVYVSVGKNLSPALRIDGGVNYEFSNLKVRGDATADRTLKFLKPNFTSTGSRAAAGTPRLSIRRTVAQLDFYDFMSAANLSTNQVSGGNENLQPQRSLGIPADRRPSVVRRRLVQARSGARPCQHASGPDPDLRPGAPERREPLLRRAGQPWHRQALFRAADVDAPLDKLWSGLRVKFTGTYQKTRVEDPVDHHMRRWSNFWPDWQWDLSVRRDRGPFSYGFEFNDNQRWTTYRTDGFDTNFNGGAYGTAFVEYRPLPRTSITLNVDNALNTTANLSRLIYYPNRVAPEDGDQRAASATITSRSG